MSYGLGFCFDFIFGCLFPLQYQYQFQAVSITSLKYGVAFLSSLFHSHFPLSPSHPCFLPSVGKSQAFFRIGLVKSFGSFAIMSQAQSAERLIAGMKSCQ